MSSEFPEIERVKKSMAQLSDTIGGLVHSSKPGVGVHHSPFFKDYLTHAAVAEHRPPGNSSAARPASLDAGRANILRPQPVPSYVPNVTHTSSVRPVPTSMTQSLYEPPRQPVVVSSHRGPQTYSRHDTRASWTTPRLAGNAIPTDKEKAKSNRVRFADGFGDQFSKTLDYRPVVSSSVRVPSPPRAPIATVYENQPQIDRRPVIRPSATFFGRPRSSSIQTENVKVVPQVYIQEQPAPSIVRTHMQPQPQKPSPAPQESLANQIASRHILELAQSPDKWFELVRAKFEKEKQMVSTEFDAMLKETIEQTDRVKLQVFAQVDQLAAGVIDLVRDLSAQAQQFIRHATSVQQE